MGWFYGTLTLKALLHELRQGSQKDNPKAGSRLERRLVANKFVGNPAFSGVFWTVWQLYEVQANGSEEAISRPWIHCDLLKCTKSPTGNPDWGHKPIGTEADGPCYYSCPKKYLKLAAVANRTWRQLVADYHEDKLHKKAVKLESKKHGYSAASR